MPVSRRFVLAATALAFVGYVWGQPRSIADDEKPSTAEERAAAPSAPIDDAAQKESQPDLKQILERLNRLERELLELRIKSGKIPEDKKDQRIISLVDTPYLGSVFFG